VSTVCTWHRAEDVFQRAARGPIIGSQRQDAASDFGSDHNPFLLPAPSGTPPVIGRIRIELGAQRRIQGDKHGVPGGPWRRLLRRSPRRIAEPDQVGGMRPIDGVDGVVDCCMQHREAARRWMFAGCTPGAGTIQADLFH